MSAWEASGFKDAVFDGSLPSASPGHDDAARVESRMNTEHDNAWFRPLAFFGEGLVDSASAVVRSGLRVKSVMLELSCRRIVLQ